jgi:ubiquitin-conjugating enzyme E2 Z
MEGEAAKATKLEPQGAYEEAEPQVAYVSSSKFDSPTKLCIRRIQSDLRHLFKDPVDGIFVVPDETRVNICHAIIIGPSDTPYEFGIFLFFLEFPNDYPHSPPRVTLKTTGGGVVRFNPNLYACGKVCLSILGTWSGPSWSPVHTIGSVLLSIRSLMNSSPYNNEPGFENTPISAPEPKHYNHYIRYETVRVAVLDMVDLASKTQYLPQSLASLICSIFVDSAEFCKYTCDEYSFLDGRSFQNKFSKRLGTFDFANLKCRIERMEQEIQAMELASSKRSATGPIMTQHETYVEKTPDG